MTKASRRILISITLLYIWYICVVQTTTSEISPDSTIKSNRTRQPEIPLVEDIDYSRTSHDDPPKPEYEYKKYPEGKLPYFKASDFYHKKPFSKIPDNERVPIHYKKREVSPSDNQMITRYEVDNIDSQTSLFNGVSVSYVDHGNSRSFPTVTNSNNITINCLDTSKMVTTITNSYNIVINCLDHVPRCHMVTSITNSHGITINAVVNIPNCNMVTTITNSDNISVNCLDHKPNCNRVTSVTNTHSQRINCGCM